jgi:hypothetical protein
MTYSCADFVETMSEVFPDQQPEGNEDWEGEVLAEFADNIVAEVERLRKIEAGLLHGVQDRISESG